MDSADLADVFALYKPQSDRIAELESLLTTATEQLKLQEETIRNQADELVAKDERIAELEMCPEGFTDITSSLEGMIWAIDTGEGGWDSAHDLANELHYAKPGKKFWINPNWHYQDEEPVD